MCLKKLLYLSAAVNLNIHVKFICQAQNLKVQPLPLQFDIMDEQLKDDMLRLNSIINLRKCSLLVVATKLHYRHHCTSYC